MKPRLVLFDIDQTLIHGAGCGRRALEKAFEAIFGFAKALDSISMSGRTDTAIVLDVMNHQGINQNQFRKKESLLWKHYISNLKNELYQSPEARVEIGVPELLRSLQEAPRTHLALLTGNIREGAQTKLEHFGLWSCFPVGAFGDDDPDRNKVARIALNRSIQYYKTSFEPENTYVVGDSPHDLEAAKTLGARSILVATGIHSYEVLSQKTSFALFHDFSKIAMVLYAMQGKASLETNPF